MGYKKMQPIYIYVIPEIQFSNQLMQSFKRIYELRDI
jgi:hypothetical protein